MWIASVAAVAIQPLVFMARIAPDYYSSSQPRYGLSLALLGVAVVAAAVVLILGIPTFLLLRRLHRAGWTSLAVAGLILGALPVAVLSWPRSLEGYSEGQNWHGKYVDIYINGVPTKYAWLTYGESVMYFGLHGFAGALIFYAVWRWLDRTNIALHTGCQAVHGRE